MQKHPHLHTRGDGTYVLHRYVWRSLLTIFGPLMVLGFYCFIVLEFLQNQPSNNIVTASKTDARWVFYVWFVVAIFILEWTRAGLANIEAAALMLPQLAPRTALSLMWHTDMKWSSPLWWLRAFRFFTQRLRHVLSSSKIKSIPGPNLLWFFLSLNTLTLFVAIPLSGLTIELTNVYVPSDTQALIYGPNSTTFNARGASEMPLRVFDYWQSGPPAAPLYNGLLYAPDGTANVSPTYFDDNVLLGVGGVTFFTGSSVRESVAGVSWGIESKISCSAVTAGQLKLIQIHDVNNCFISMCLPNEDETDCYMSWQNTSEATRLASSSNLPMWFNISAEVSPGDFNFSMVVAADGWSQDMYGSTNPYTQVNNHDNLTLDHINNRTAAGDTTTSIFEIFLWQGTIYESLIPQNLSNDKSGVVEVINHRFDDLEIEGSVNFYGMGIHCDVRTAVGEAHINPGHRTYSSFKRGNAPPASLGTGLGDLALTLPAQQLALITLQSQTAKIYGMNDVSSTWVALHNAIGSAVLPPSGKTGSAMVALTPADLQLAMYRLLGDSIIGMMDEGGSDQWRGGLYRLQSSRYITSGVVSWKYVVVLMSLWTALISGGAMWMLFCTGPRWAASLNGFEMFKFGAQHTEDMDSLETVEFHGCESSLSGIPGMVGILPGYSLGTSGGLENGSTSPGFIGLSESVAEKRAKYTFDRKQAAATRYTVTVVG